MWSCTLEGRLVHAGHAGAVVLPWETMDVNFQRYRANRRTEVKQTHLLHREEGRGRVEKKKEKRFNVSRWQREAPSGCNVNCLSLSLRPSAVLCSTFDGSSVFIV